LARDFSVSERVVSRICRRESWRHI
jgi:hypothetical protein